MSWRGPKLEANKAKKVNEKVKDEVKEGEEGHQKDYEVEAQHLIP